MAITRGTLPVGAATGGAPLTTAPFSTSSNTATGTSTAPTAGTAIATLAAPAAGQYQVQVWLAVAGTATTAAADSNNMNLKAQGVAIATNLPYNCSTAGNLTNGGPFTFMEVLNGSQNLTVNAVGNATAGTVYSAMIVATRVA